MLKSFGLRSVIPCSVYDTDGELDRPGFWALVNITCASSLGRSFFLTK